MQFSTLSDWLAYIATLHAFEIALGLERVKIVAERLALLKPDCAVIIVGGTNGKGSTVTSLEAIYRAAHYQTGSFTSPYLFRYNEQIRVNGREISDEALCVAFAAIETARGDISLTPFEFGTLAALYHFKKQALDILILEVGLGGRLDAVNIIDADVSVITSIDIDHVEWLGNTREKIALEKAGIFRKNKPAVCGDPHPPQSLLEYVNHQQIPFFCQGRDFQYQEKEQGWLFSYQETQYEHLAFNALTTQNLATALMAITLLQNRLPVTRDAIDKGLCKLTLPGRIQIINEPVVKIYDVSHNPHAVALLANRLKSLICTGKTYAVFSMLTDKDILKSLAIIQPLIDAWYVAPLTAKRAATTTQLKEAFQQREIHGVNFFSSIQAAYFSAEKTATPGDRIIIFGSFHTVADMWQVVFNKA
ncbi:MAG: bifunctional tetrahydrofolate synthase/dihydrofolate synthase [Gammaproteobacteria bacterium]|nr:bifunctional tetrahydrofolate synthase/dihydrofolate synthase [Gammaproteobacteria bacterium]